MVFEQRPEGGEGLNLPFRQREEQVVLSSVLICLVPGITLNAGVTGARWGREEIIREEVQGNGRSNRARLQVSMRTFLSEMEAFDEF